MSKYRQNFEQLELLGDGTFGQVYKVKHKQNNQYYAIKIVILEVDENNVSKNDIKKEVSLLKQLDPNYVIKYYDDWLEGDSYYIQMKLGSINMETVMKRLEMILKETKQSSSTEHMDLVINFIRCRLFIEIIECLEYLHQNIPVIIHRDIKLQNILVVLPDELVDPMNRFIRLCDFGLATVHERSLMSHTSSVGTTRYMAPEVLEGRKYNSMVDIYSLGIVGQELFGVNIYEENRDSHPIPNLIELFNRMIDRMSNERPSCTEILLLANEWTITAETINNVVTNMSEIRHIFRVNNQQPVDVFLNRYLTYHLQ